MSISVTCSCGKALSVKDELAGKRIRCPACQQIINVSLASQTTTPVAKALPVGLLIGLGIGATLLGMVVVAGGTFALLAWRSSSKPTDAVASTAPDLSHPRPETGTLSDPVNAEPAKKDAAVPVPEKEKPAEPEPMPKDRVPPEPAAKEKQPAEKAPIEKPPEKPPVEKAPEKPPAEKPPAEKPPADPPKKKPDEPKIEKPDDRIGQLIESVLGAKSDQYKEDGYRQYVFGTTDKEINAKTPLKVRMFSPAFQNEQGDEFLFYDHKLVAVAKTYKDDNTGYLAKLKELFGTVAKENIDEWKVLNPDARRGEPLVEWVSDVSYFFPKTIAVVRVVKSRIVLGNADDFRDDEKVVVLVLSRAWVTSVLRDDLERKRATMQWLKETVARAKQGAFEPKKWPALPGMVLKEDVNGSRKAAMYVEQNIYNAKLDTFRLGASPAFTCVIDKLSQDSKELNRKKDSVAAAVNFNCFDPAKPFLDRTPKMNRWASKHPLLLTSASELVGKVNSPLVQEFFPPKGTSITVKREEGVRKYEWETKDGWRVMVYGNDTVVIGQLDNDL